ncbi:RNA polymerase sigma-70 factor (ECF subfamily) [Paenibacillus eucommiae]|uniref:RNA polymerase sigma factor n=2 Tax=Paenibacillus eucommiae TaxID=1355755 RepID=A0ABS4J3E2_9BACL|nr:RNA polymerase sigma-70 factor (ECF subfamily) [Paenibacillus eucommiae]
MVKDHAATEDIIQDSFIKVLKKTPECEDLTKLKAWIRVVAKNTTYNYLRKNKKNHNHLDIESVFINENFIISSESVESIVEAKIMADDITRYLDHVKKEYRILIELRWKKGLSYKEIAEELDITEEIVKQKLYRAREAVKKKMSLNRDVESL